MRSAFALAASFLLHPAAVVLAGTPPPAADAPVEPIPLARCIEIALQQSRLRPASQFGVDLAEAQHRQALSAYWPQVKATAGYQRLDEPLNFLFPASAFPIPSQTIQTPAGAMTVTIPANAFGPGFPPQNVQMPVAVPAQTITTPAQQFGVPAQDIQLVQRNVAAGSMDMKWLLYDGGMRQGMRQQTTANIAVQKQEVRRTDLEIVETVKRYYWGAVLALQLHSLGRDALGRMEGTLRLTEGMYKAGAGKVAKTDYLDNLIMVESLRAMVATLEKNEKLSQAALANALGYSWSSSVRPADSSIPAPGPLPALDALVGESYKFNPDWAKLESALVAAEGALKTAKSAYQPKLALTGEIRRWWNSGGNSGAFTAQNRAGWTAGVGVEIPIFNGFLTQAKINEVRAQIAQWKEKQFLLREGLGLQIRDVVLGLEAAVKADAATALASKSAEENRDLNTRAYESELVETEKVIRAQLMESLMTAQHYLARYQITTLSARLSLLVGKEIAAAAR